MRIRILGVAAAAVFSVGAGAFALQNDDDSDAPALSPQQLIDIAPESVWRPTDQDNLLYMDVPSGVIVIEMRPDFAPEHVARIKELTREGFYDGLTFHRVIEGFMAQGGDPKGDGTGGSDKPDLVAEFTRDTGETDGFIEIGRDRIASRIGYIDGMPTGAEPESLRSFQTGARVSIWPLHCPGVMSMARASPPNSANSQFFLMIGDSRLNLDRSYTAWGWIIDGYENSRRIMRGEPPSRPTPIIRVRVGSDVPAREQKTIEVMRTDSDEFVKYLIAKGEVQDGFVKDICDIKVPVRVNGKVER
ncbi:MAG: peptidylprolyl isomerase [Pseudomonadota bacterium]